jgi:hypothetical protein
MIKKGIPELITNKQLGVTSLCQLIRYQQSPTDGMNSIKNGLSTLWANRKRTPNKENFPLLAAFAVKGQGKTELCRQLVLADDLHDNLPGVEKVVTIHVSFSQDSTYNEADREFGIIQGLIWRILDAFSADYSFATRQKENIQLADVIAVIRDECRTENSTETSKIGIFILLDEFMKVDVDSERTKLLNEICSLQQKHLQKEIPTFFFVTSLTYVPVDHIVRTDSGRHIFAIPLPVLADSSLEEIANLIHDSICKVLACSPDLQATELRAFNAKGDLRRLISVAVYVSGRHFRSLETVVKVIVSVL